MDETFNLMIELSNLATLILDRYNRLIESNEMYKMTLKKKYLLYFEKEINILKKLLKEEKELYLSIPLDTLKEVSNKIKEALKIPSSLGAKTIFLRIDNKCDTCLLTNQDSKIDFIIRSFMKTCLCNGLFIIDQNLAKLSDPKLILDLNKTKFYLSYYNNLIEEELIETKFVVPTFNYDEYKLYKVFLQDYDNKIVTALKKQVVNNLIKGFIANIKEEVKTQNEFKIRENIMLLEGTLGLVSSKGQVKLSNYLIENNPEIAKYINLAFKKILEDKYLIEANNEIILGLTKYTC